MPTPSKIIIATPLYPPEIGGPATFVKNFEEDLAARHIPYAVVPFSSVRRLPKVARHIAYFFRVLSVASRGDLVLALDPVSVGLPALMAARVRGARFFLRLGGDYAWEQGVQRFGVTLTLDEFVSSRRPLFPLLLHKLSIIERYVARRAERVLVQSRYFAGIIEKWGIEPIKISVVPNSVATVPLVSRDEARRKLGWKNSERIILSAGRFVPWKGFTALIDAVAELNKKFPDARLHIAGNGPLFTELQARARKHTLPVIFLGAVSQKDLGLMLAAADVFVLNTGYEGFSHQVLEAFMAGVPVVTTRAGGNADVVSDNENALAVPFNDADAIVAAMERIFSEAGLGERLARVAREKAEEFPREKEYELMDTALGISSERPTKKNEPRVLMLSGDANALIGQSAVHQRLLIQAKHVGWLEVLVRAPRSADVLLGEHGIVRGFSGTKYSAARAMRRALRGTRFDIVTAQDPFLLGLLAVRFARALNAKLHIQLHTDIFSPAYAAYSLGNRFRLLLAKFVLRRADCVRVVSERIKKSFLQFGHRAPVSVLPIYIDTDAIHNAPVASIRREFTKFTKILLVAARLEAEKNVSAAILSMKNILKEFPDAGLCIAGDGSQKTALAELARNLGLEKNVVFLGHRNDMYSLYKSADVVIAATAPYEGYGATTVEALAAGTPVVSDDAGVAREAGATVAPPEGIADAVVGILRSGARGVLATPLLSKEAYAEAWKDSLLVCIK